MKEIKDIIIAFDKAQKKGKQTALATVVHVDGSSYRRPGARMLITEDGELTGAISGGCLEGDALRKALHVMTQQKSMLVTYDTMDDDDAKFGVGLGCNGIIQVLIEPIDIKNENNPISFFKSITAQRQSSVLVTLYSLQDKKKPQPGTCLLIKEDNSITGQIPVLNDILIEDAKAALQNHATSFKNYISENENLTVFIEFLKPPVSLIIIGAGNDVMPLVQMADVLGWESTIVDGRPNYARKERFASACQVLVSKPENVLDQLVIDDQTVFLLMTHNYNYDLAMLRALINKNTVYIGSLGPKKKMDRMLRELKEEGIILTDQQRAILYGPVGLDIGAETSEEIALSILAEIKTVLAGRQGQFLRTGTDTIHSPSQTFIEEVRIKS
ncbi:MAG: Xanthine dehydrogenase [Chitinophagaceae bacterium]|nr:Xanthine dehydrogenase [Chitinophagaceae bacterium]